MSFSPLNDMTAWCGECFVLREEGALSMFMLAHYSANGTETPQHVMSSKLPADKFTPEVVATTMDAIASRHARGLSGVQQYQLMAAYGTSGKPLAFLPFQRSGGLTHGPLPGGGLATEAPTSTGIAQVGMRWGELAIQQAGAKDQMITGLMGQLLDKVLVRLETTERRSDERWLALQNLLVQWQQQSMNSQLRALGIEAGRKLLPLLPAAISTMTGSDALVPAAAVQESVFDALVENYSGAQLQELIGSMPTGDAGSAVGALIADQLLRAKKRKAARDRERSEGGTRTLEEGANDAAGRALRALGAQPEPAPSNGGARIVQRLARHANGHNDGGNGNGHSTAKAAAPTSDAAKAALFDDLTRAMPEAHALLVGALDERAPELAARLKAHLAARDAGE